MADFDIIVVGSGCAGAVAAYTAASAGKSVLVVERGVFAGAKNMIPLWRNHSEARR